MTLPQFLCPDATARIEPATFMTHLLTHRGTDIPSIGLRQTVVLSFIPELERRVLRAVGEPPPQPHPVQRQTLYHPEGYPFSAITSPMGAPMAAMLLEQLIALGGRRFLYLGFCGALDPSYRIGDCFIPTHGIREEGTSYHYLSADVAPTASAEMNAQLMAEADAQQLAVRQGPVWTTDAPYRETARKIRHFQQVGVHAVDMEMSALLAVAAYRQCAVAALMIVSDECYHPTWKPGFGSPRLRRGCRAAVAVAVATAQRLGAAAP